MYLLKEQSSNEPKVTSLDPEERKLARRLRIQKRLELMQTGTEVSETAVKDLKYKTKIEDDPRYFVENQIESGLSKLLQLLQNGTEIVSNVRVAVMNHATQMREDAAKAKEARRLMLEQDSLNAAEKFRQISDNWQTIYVQNDPLEIHRLTEAAKGQCQVLLQQKDDVIEDLKRELKETETKYFDDLKKQEADVNVLIDRINKQLDLLRSACRDETEKIEDAIDKEREELMRRQKKSWEKLVEKRENIERATILERFRLMEEHGDDEDQLLLKHQEVMRARRLTMNNIINAVRLEVEQMRTVAALNLEKLSYNYQILQKRVEENQMIKAQQKRRITKLRDKLTFLRNSNATTKQNMTNTVQRLTRDLNQMHRSIEQNEEKAIRFKVINCEKYLKLWDFNQKKAANLIEKIYDAEKALYEIVLGHPWTRPKDEAISREELPSFKQGVQLQKDDTDVPLIRGNFEVNTLTEQEETNLLTQIVKLVADNSGFVIEGKLEGFISSLSEQDKTLVTLDNIFIALGITEEKHIRTLVNYFIPHAYCQTCLLRKRRSNEWLTYNEIEDILHKEDVALEKKDSSEVGIVPTDETFLDDLTNIVRDRFNIIQTLVSNELSKLPPDVKRVDSEELQLAIQKLESTPFGESALWDKKIALKLREGGPLERIIDTHKVTDSEHTKIAEVAADSNSYCLDPTHKPAIDPQYVVKALREFLQDLYAERAMKQQKTLTALMSKSHITVARNITEEDVEFFWKRYCSVLNKQRDDIWNAIFLGLQRYYKTLQERHNLNEQIKRYRRNNDDLRRLISNFLLKPLDDVDLRQMIDEIQTLLPELKGQGT